jgi:hypothetical protein
MAVQCSEKGLSSWVKIDINNIKEELVLDRKQSNVVTKRPDFP